jgi:hypothetical protein
VGNAFKYLGNGFKNLYESFTQMFGSAFKLPKIDLSGIKDAFSKAVNTIKTKVGELTKAKKTTSLLEVGAARRLLSENQVQDKWFAFGGYASLKFGEPIAKAIVNAFCSVVKVLVIPIKNLFNAVVKLITGIIPAWLLKIAAFGGIGFLATFLYSAFTLGFGWGYTYGISTDAYEAGMALELGKDMQIGRTGCYLGGSSGLTQGSVGVSTGFVVGAFKKYDNIAGDSTTIGVEGDICKFFGLPCKLAIAAAIIWDNTDWHNGNSLALKTFKTCLGQNAEYAIQIENLEISHEMAVNMVQTMDKEQLKLKILQQAYNFFKKGFGVLKACIISIFNLWIGNEIGISGGVEVGAPVKGTFQLDYTYCATHGQDGVE